MTLESEAIKGVHTISSLVVAHNRFSVVEDIKLSTILDKVGALVKVALLILSMCFPSHNHFSLLPCSSMKPLFRAWNQYRREDAIWMQSDSRIVRLRNSASKAIS